MNRAIFSYCVAFALIGVCMGQGLTCYSCQTSKFPCEHTGFTGNETKTCPHACVKHTQHLTTGIDVQRRCLTDKEINEGLTKFHGCKESLVPFVGTDVKVQTCVCHNDMCNAASNVVAAPVLVALLCAARQILI